jgi:8-oxo-dGTP pyrophosphatase MutT (NUDIX family)
MRDLIDKARRLAESAWDDPEFIKDLEKEAAKIKKLEKKLGKKGASKIWDDPYFIPKKPQHFAKGPWAQGAWKDPGPKWSPKKTKPYKPHKWTSAGGIVIPSLHPDEIDFVYIRKPSGGFGGHTWTFPKGKVDEGESLLAAALREVAEETGIKARALPGGKLGKFQGSMSVTHYFMMVQTGGKVGKTDFETEEVRLVSFDEAEKLLRGNTRDVKVLKKARAWIASNISKKKKGRKKRVKVKTVRVSAKEAAKDYSIQVKDYKDPSTHRADRSKLVLTIPRKRPLKELTDFLKALKIKETDLIQGQQNFLAIVPRRAFDRASLIEKRPQTKRFR